MPSRDRGDILFLLRTSSRGIACPENRESDLSGKQITSSCLLAMSIQLRKDKADSARTVGFSSAEMAPNPYFLAIKVK